jgi:hypothetical protein
VGLAGLAGTLLLIGLPDTLLSDAAPTDAAPDLFG